MFFLLDDIINATIVFIMRYGDLEFINFSNVLTCIEQSTEKLSRADVAKHLGLSRTTASIIANKLVALDILREERSVTNGRGRPGTPLSIETSTWFAIGASYHPPQCAFVITNLRGQVVDKYMTYIDSYSPELFVEKLLEGLRRMLDRCPGKLFPALAVGVPGVIDTETGKIKYSYDLNWLSAIPLKEIIESKLGITTYMLNRYQASSLAEFRYGRWKRIPNMVYLGLGTGLRISLFVDGKLVEGANFSAGRIAHTQIDPDGPLCGCGQRGCLQAMSNEQALIATAKELRESAEENPKFLASPLWDLPLDDCSILHITAAADAGDPFACECVNRIAAPLIRILATIVDTVDPQLVIIGGPLGNCCSYLTKRIRSELKRIGTSENLRKLSVEQSSIDSYGSAAGAVSVALEHKLELLLPLLTN